MLFYDKEFPDEENQQVTKLCTKLDKFALLLDLTPHRNNFKGKLLPVSYDTIQGIPTICPSTPICLNAQCEPRGLLQSSMLRDIPLVTLIKDNTVYQNVPVLTGKCTTCDTNITFMHLHLHSCNFGLIAIQLPTPTSKSHGIRFGKHLFKNQSEQLQQPKILIWS
jgi:KDZ transposase family protein